MSVVFVSRSLRASSMFTSRHQLGRSTRKAFQCFWTRCALPRQHHLLPNRYLATTSCHSHLRSSFSLRPAYSVGDLWRVKAPRGLGRRWTLCSQLIWLSHITSGLRTTQCGPKRTFSFLHFTAGHFFFLFCTCHKPHQSWAISAFSLSGFALFGFAIYRTLKILQSLGAWTFSGTQGNILNMKFLSCQFLYPLFSHQILSTVHMSQIITFLKNGSGF